MTPRARTSRLSQSSPRSCSSPGTHNATTRPASRVSTLPHNSRSPLTANRPPIRWAQRTLAKPNRPNVHRDQEASATPVMMIRSAATFLMQAEHFKIPLPDQIAVPQSVLLGIPFPPGPSPLWISWSFDRDRDPVRAAEYEAVDTPERRLR